MNIVKNIISGGIIGIANIVPGVSGGTMAVILNIYDELIQSISDLRTQPKKSIEFLAPIGIGAVIAILLCSNGISFLLSAQYMIVNFFFIGIILGSIPMLYKRGTKNGFKPTNLLPLFITFSLMLGMIFFSDAVGIEETIITTLTIPSFIQLFLASAVSAICMIVPGVSGSFVMLLFGTYTTIVTAVSQLNILILIPVGLGVLAGILGGAKLIEIVLVKHETSTYFAILGFVFGSIPVLLNNIILEGEFTFGIKFIIAIIVMIIGIAITILFDNPKLKQHFENRK